MVNSTIVILRHLKTEQNEAKRFQGNSDSKLIYTRGDLLRRKAFLLEFEEGFDVFYTSPLQRCRLTYDLLTGTGLKLPRPRDRDELKEIDCGVYTMKPFTSLPQDVIQYKLLNKFDFSLPQGESMVDVHRRLEGMISELKVTRGRVFGVLTHAVVASVLAYALTDMETSRLQELLDTNILHLDNDQAFILEPNKNLILEDI